MAQEALRDAAGLSEQFEARVEPDLNSGCWLWSRGQTTDGYGTFQMERRTVLAHRASWAIYRGKLPAGQMVCHRCDTPACVNPSHLFLGSQTENMADMKAKGRADRQFGARNGRAILSDDQAREILDLKGLGFGQRPIARSYGVSDSTVSRIIRRESFPHVWPYTQGAKL